MRNSLRQVLESRGNSPSRAMADVAVCMVTKGDWRFVQVTLGTLMLVRVVPQVHCGGAVLVLAVRRSRSPDGLQRKEDEEQDSEPAAHRLRLYSSPHTSCVVRATVRFIQ